VDKMVSHKSSCGRFQLGILIECAGCHHPSCVKLVGQKLVVGWLRAVAATAPWYGCYTQVWGCITFEVCSGVFVPLPVQQARLCRHVQEWQMFLTMLLR
jgi:hypothetical protein